MDSQSNERDAPLDGQWVGGHGNSGFILLDVEARGAAYEGRAFIGEADRPASAVRVRIVRAAGGLSVSVTDMSPVDPNTGQRVEWDAIKANYPGFSMSKSADVSASFVDGSIKLQWMTDIGVQGAATVSRYDLRRPSDLVPERMRWREFKETISRQKDRSLLFRGQSKPWRLQTSFHRRGRVDLQRFLNEDMLEAHPHVAAATNARFDRGAGDDLVMLSLMQHHGYPTPLLDWTRSPYIAAFFAFRGVVSAGDPSDHVRVFMFDHRAWRQLSQLPSITCASPHLSLLELLPLGNPRMLPQQAVSTLTNLADVENYLEVMGRAAGVTYLRAIDLPASERDEVMHDLRFMGITAASLFPGLDGLFEELRDRNFSS